MHGDAVPSACAGTRIGRGLDAGWDDGWAPMRAQRDLELQQHHLDEALPGRQHRVLLRAVGRRQQTAVQRSLGMDASKSTAVAVRRQRVKEATKLGGSLLSALITNPLRLFDTTDGDLTFMLWGVEKSTARLQAAMSRSARRQHQQVFNNTTCLGFVTIFNFIEVDRAKLGHLLFLCEVVRWFPFPTIFYIIPHACGFFTNSLELIKKKRAGVHLRSRETETDLNSCALAAVASPD